MRVPFVETFCIEKDSYIDAIKCENSFKLCIFIPKYRKLNTFGTPPPKKKAQGYERSRYGYTDNSYEYTLCTGGLLGIAQCVYSQLHAQMIVMYQQSVTWYSLGRDWVIRCCTITRAQK